MKKQRAGKELIDTRSDEFERWRGLDKRLAKKIDRT